jgi:hypothetical protein
MKRKESYTHELLARRAVCESFSIYQLGLWVHLGLYSLQYFFFIEVISSIWGSNFKVATCLGV